MKLKLFTILSSQATLSTLWNSKLGGVTAFRLMTNIKSLEKHIVTYQKTINALIEKNGAPKKDAPGEFEVLPERMSEHQAEVESLLEEEVDVDIIPIKPEYIEGITPQELYTIEFMIKP